jgi:hypothetical protein
VEGGERRLVEVIHKGNVCIKMMGRLCISVYHLLSLC